MEHILIIGGNGAGKTTFSKILAKKLQLPLIHLDRLYWRDHWQPAPQNEFDESLMQELMKSQWILDGNMGRTLPLRLQYCDTVIYLDFPRSSCIYGAIKRMITCYGQSRPDLGGYCPERLSIRFLKDVWNFNRNNQVRYYKMLDKTKDIKIIILKNRKQLAEFLQGLSI